MRTIDGTLLLPSGAARGRLVFSGGVIVSVEVHDRPGPAAALPGPYVLPGFVDVHVHGGGGADAMDGPGGTAALARFHATRGTTTLLPTTITHPWSDVLAALRGVGAVREAARAGEEGLPDVPGAHLEGPFVNPGRLGAQPPFAVDPAAELVAEALGLDVVRVVTLAPELPGALEAAAAFARAGVRVSVGHTLATAEQAEALLAAVRAVSGVAGFTHLYNAMTPLGSREPGAVGAALASAEAYAEVILDLHHVHRVAFRAALAAKRGRLLLVTDAMRAAGAEEGESELGGQPVVVAGGAARLRDGTLAGSVLTMDRAVRNAVACGLDLTEASALASAVPAAYLGLVDRGVLAPARRADLVVLDGELNVTDVYVAGRPLG